MTLCCRLTVAGFVCVLSSPAFAQQPADPEPRVIGTVSNVTRVENWSFFQPAPEASRPDLGAGRPDYTFIGNRTDLGARVEGVRFDLTGAFSYTRVENLPTDAFGPGGLGTGAFYFAASGIPYSYQLYFHELTLRAKTRDNRLSATVGRMGFASGAESTSDRSALERLKRDRLDSRLVGEFEWSFYQRRFDGVRVDVERPRWHVAASALLPTQGGFEESTILTMTKVQVGGAAFNYRQGSDVSPREWQVFSYLYRDRRDVTARPDNTGFPASAVDVSVAAIGGSHAAIVQTRAGALDAIVWAAGEFGDWYGQPHRAASIAAEVGHRWTEVRMRPGIRGGYSYASGDDDPYDGRHGTFFQMLPSSRKYALSSTYTQMNLRDAFVQAFFEPGRSVTARVDVHRLDLASAADRWYEGSGATASTGRYFGFSGRPSSGATALGTVVEGTLDVPIVRHWSLNGYAGTMWGGQVVTRQFAGSRLTFWYVENVISF